jgi:hypothetical protein
LIDNSSELDLQDLGVGSHPMEAEEFHGFVVITDARYGTDTMDEYI